MIIKQVPLDPDDKTFSFKNTECSMTTMARNKYTGLWTFDLITGSNIIRGVPIVGGVNVVKGKGAVCDRMFFIDPTDTTGDIKTLYDTKLYITG